MVSLQSSMMNVLRTSVTKGNMRSGSCRLRFFRLYCRRSVVSLVRYMFHRQWNISTSTREELPRASSLDSHEHSVRNVQGFLSTTLFSSILPPSSTSQSSWGTRASSYARDFQLKSGWNGVRWFGSPGSSMVRLTQHAGPKYFSQRFGHDLHISDNKRIHAPALSTALCHLG